MEIGLDSRTLAQPDTSKVTSSSTCTPSRRLFATTTKARQRLLPRRRGSAGQASGNPWVAGRIALSPLDGLRAGGFGRFCPAITRCSLATTSTFKAAEYAALSPGSVVNSFLRRLGIWVHGSRYGVSRSRTTDCPSERHVSAKRESPQATVDVRSQESVLGRSHPIDPRPSRRREWISREPTSDALSYSRPDCFERTSLSDFESRGPPDTASTTGRELAIFRCKDKRYPPLGVELGSHRDIEGVERHDLCVTPAGRVVQISVVDPVVGDKVHASTPQDEQG